MLTRHKLLAFVLLLLVLISIVVSLLLRQEQRYKGKTAISWFQEMQPLQPSPALDALSKLHRSSIPLLEKELKDRLPNNRYKAAWALGKVGPAAIDAIPDLIRTIQDENPSVRYYTIQSLTALNATNEELYPALRRAIGDQNKSVSANAAKLLNKLEGERKDAHLQPFFSNQVEYAKAFLNSVSPQVQLMGVDRLGRLTNQLDEVVPILSSLTNDPNISIRANAKMYLSAFDNHLPPY